MTHTGQGQMIEADTIQQDEDGDWVPAQEELYYPSFSRRILHFFGVHNWTWTLPESGSMDINAGENVKCVQCGIFRTPPKQN